MKINEVLTEDNINEISMADIKNKLSGSRSGMNTSLLGRMAGAVSKKGMNIGRGIADKFSASPEVAQNITQGVNAWLGHVKRLQASGKITNTTPAEQYADYFVDFMSKMARINKADLTGLKTGLVIGLNSGNGMAALRRAVTQVVGMKMTGAAGASELAKKTNDLYNRVLHQMPAIGRNVNQSIAVKNLVKQTVASSPNASEDDLMDNIESQLQAVIGGRPNP